MRVFLFSLNFVILLILGFFAKDNLLAKGRQLLSTNVKENQTTKPSANIEVAFSPNGGATQTIIKAIDNAKNSILVAAYSFTSSDIAKALLLAKKNNITVKIILDKSQISQRYSSSTFFKSQGFDLKIDHEHAIFHNKFMIIDDDTVITGSFNFTKAAENKNAENIIIIKNNKQLANLYKKNWELHWRHSMFFPE